MIKMILKISWRNIRKNGSFMLINLCSLVLGITLFFLISLWARDELSYDSRFAEGPAVCRVETNLITPEGVSETTSTVGWPVGKQLTARYPEIESLTYLRNWRPVIRHKQAYFFEKGLMADEHFFSVFGYPLQEGDAATALKNPFSIVISPEVREKYFGSTDALGKMLILDDSVQYKITGVLAELPERSHLKFDMIASFSSFCSMFPQDCAQEFASGWFDLNVFNYVKLHHSASVTSTQAKITNLVLEAGKEQVAATGFKSTLALRPVQDIYLNSGAPTAGGPMGSIKLVKLFGGIGLFILLIACLNFINLSTAKSVERAREIGVQKVLGNSGRRIILQFLCEAALLCVLAAIISLLLSLAVLQPFNSFTGKDFVWTDIFTSKNLLSLSLIILVLIPLAGFYPALVLSRFKPVSVLKGSFVHSSSGILMRKVLVVTQFIISAGLIMSTLIMWKQMKFMQNKELGFDKENILLVSTAKLPWGLSHEKAPVFKAMLSENAGVKSITACNAVPGRFGWNGQFAYPEGRPKEDALSVEYIPVDADYIKTIGLQLSAGRDFIEGSKEDAEESFIINETAVKYFGWGDAANAIGKRLSTSGKDGRIVGVIKDYHQHGLQEAIRAIVLSPMANIKTFAIRYEGVAASRMIQYAKSAWEKVYTGYPMEYRFLDEDFQQQYQKEEKQQAFMALAAVLAIVIGSLGLLGLVMYTAQKRVKEIGIRKVLGANVGGIVALLSYDLLRLVGLAVLLTIPLSWWLMHNWLQQFAYRITIGWWVFAVAGIIALLIAMLTISVQALRAAMADPVRSLKNE